MVKLRLQLLIIDGRGVEGGGKLERAVVRMVDVLLLLLLLLLLVVLLLLLLPLLVVRQDGS